MNKEIWTVGRILQWTEQYFRSKEMDSPRLDGEVLLSHILGKDRIYLYTHYDQPLVQEELDAFRPLVQERAKGRSVASIIGEKDFMGLTFKVNEHVLIPRPDTETLVEYVLDTLPKDFSGRILDVCSGPGTILLSLLHYLPQASGMGLELSIQALQVAEQNRNQLQLAERSIFKHSDMFKAIEHSGESFDVIVSNPPYITSADMRILAPEVLAEPHMALEGGADGLDFYRILVANSGQYLVPGGILAMEIGIHQEDDVRQLLEATGQFHEIQYCKDLAGINRVIVAKRM